MKTYFVTDNSNFYELKVEKETEKIIKLEKHDKIYKHTFRKSDIGIEIFNTREDCKNNLIRRFEKKVDYYKSEVYRFEKIIEKIKLI